METDSKQPPQILKATDAEALADLSLKYFISYANRAIEKRGIFRVAISGGSTPVRFY